jgi:hypothetical protein
LYLALVFGAAALKIFTSPIYGLEDHAFARMVFASARLFDLSPNGILVLAARFGALQLVVATILALATIDRLRALWVREADSELLEAGLVFAAAASIASMTPALAEIIPGLLRLHSFHLALITLAGSLSILERMNRKRRRTSALHVAALQAAADAYTSLPPVRRVMTPGRWALLRRWANPVVH